MTGTVASPSPYRLAAAIVVSSTLVVASAERVVARPCDMTSSRAALARGYQSGTAISNDAPVIAAHSPEDGAVAEILEFLDYDAGWDGEAAAKPLAASAVDAVVFLRAAGSAAMRLEPALHADGSILLEIDGGSGGALKFRGDGSVIYALAGTAPGRMPISLSAPPTKLIRMLAA